MQALKIKYAGSTNTRGSRIIVSAAAGRMTFGYDHELNMQGNIEAAAKAWATAKGWDSEFIIGKLANGDYVATIIPREFIKAREAVALTRRAIAEGDLNGNPHCKPWGKAITAAFVELV